MKLIEELVDLANKANAAGQGTPEMVEFRVVAHPDNILAIAEEFLMLTEQKEQWVKWAKEGCAEADRLKAQLAELEKKSSAALVYGWLRVVSGQSFQIMEGTQRPPDRSGNGSGPWFAIYREPPAVSLAELVPGDYFGELVSKARVAADKAMLKFPQPNYVLLKVAEEAGEVVQAGVHYAENRMTWQEVEGEIVQLLAMLIRLVTEGDQVNGITPPDECRTAILRNIMEKGATKPPNEEAPC